MGPGIPHLCILLWIPPSAIALSPNVSAFILKESRGKSSKSGNESTKIYNLPSIFFLCIGIVGLIRSSDTAFLFLFKEFTLFSHMDSHLSSNTYTLSAASLLVRDGIGSPFSAQKTAESLTDSWVRLLLTQIQMKWSVNSLSRSRTRQGLFKPDSSGIKLRLLVLFKVVQKTVKIWILSTN